MGWRCLLQGALAKLLVFNRLDTQIQRKLVAEMFERNVNAGEILIKEGDTGLAATELYVVKSGKFEVSWFSKHVHQEQGKACVLFVLTCVLSTSGDLQHVQLPKNRSAFSARTLDRCCNGARARTCV